MIQVVTNNQTVQSGSAIPLDDVTLQNGFNVVKSGTNQLTFNVPGIYKIEYSASINSSTSSDIEIAFKINGNIMEPDLVVTPANTGTTSFYGSDLIRVNNSKCNKTSLQVINSGTEAVYTNFKVTALRVG